MTLDIVGPAGLNDCSYIHKWSQSELFQASRDLTARCYLCGCQVRKGHKFRLFRKVRSAFYAHEECFEHHKQKVIK